MGIMDNNLKFCKKCRSECRKPNYGYLPLPDTSTVCCDCGQPIIKLDIKIEDYFVIFHVSKDVNFIEAMIKLHDEDIIEYESRMSQFRANDQWYQEKHNPKPEIKSKPDVLTCPKCGSTAVTTGARGANHFWGLIGASKTVNRCGNCGHTWTPRG